MSWVGGGQDVRSVSSSVRTMGAQRREDVLLAGVLALAGLVEVALGAVPGHALVATLSLLVMAGAVMVRRIRPRICLVLVLLALAPQSYLGVPVNAQLMTLPFILVAAYSVGAHLDRRASAIGLAIGAALVSAAIAVANTDGSDFGFGLMLVTGPWIAGVLVRARQAAQAEAVAGAQSRARQAADEERERIARELHDIVSHGLSAMVVQAAAAAELVDRSPDAARTAMHEVQATGAAAMTEMHHLLALTRGRGCRAPPATGP
ncbi:MAG: histidine kinase dimerization/phosphoacceptor domain-containing protein [Dermatophilaceae bacterium]